MRRDMKLKVKERAIWWPKLFYFDVIEGLKFYILIICLLILDYRLSSIHGLEWWGPFLETSNSLNQFTSENSQAITHVEMVSRGLTSSYPGSIGQTCYAHPPINVQGVKRDKDGYLWITGRIDDMLNVSGHLISTAEVESVLVTHPAIIEAAVVARPHPVKGECLYCFVTLKNVSLHTFQSVQCFILCWRGHTLDHCGFLKYLQSNFLHLHK